MRKTLGIIAFLMTLCFAKNVSAQQPIRVHCGGTSYTDSKGQVWQTDTGYYAGPTSTYSNTNPISGTADPKLFQSERFSNGSSPMTYSFPVANGSYHVNLLFAEIYAPLDVVGGRVFNVKIQGNLVFSALDIFAAAGANTALVKGADVVVQNGVLSIEFDDVIQNAKVDGIEILPVASGPSGPPLALNFKYPDGTPVAGTLAYTVSSSLVSFQGSAPLNAGQAQCIIYANPSALGISAQFTVNLSLTDTAGHTLWQFAVAMDPSQVNLAAVQSSALNVVVQKM